MIENLDLNQITFIVISMAASAIITGFMAGFFWNRLWLTNGSNFFLLI